MYIKIWCEEFKRTALSTGSEMIVFSKAGLILIIRSSLEEAAGFFYDSQARVGFCY